MISIRTSTTRARLSRRAFLKRVGSSAALLPLLDAERAHGAAGDGAVKRLVTICWTNGMPQSRFWPAGTDPTDTDVLRPLEGLEEKVLIPAGLDMKVMLDDNRKYDGHFSYPTLFTGTYKNLGGQIGGATGPSIDQVYADAVAKTTNLPLPILNAAVGGKSTSFGKTGERNTAETDPARLFSRLFASGAAPADRIENLRKRRKSVLDFLVKEIEDYGRRLGSEDRGKIGAHLDAIRKLELELAAAAASGQCKTAAAPGAAGAYEAKLKAFLDLAALAIRCDLTRAVSMVWGDDGGSSPGSFPFLGLHGDYHDIAHLGAAGYANKVKIDTWYFSQVAYFAKLLRDMAEADTTALDRSVILVGNDMSEGSAHYVGRIPFVVIGSGGGTLKTGRVVRLGAWVGKGGEYWNTDSGVPHNKLLATVLGAVGVPVSGFGVNYAGTLPELS